MICPDFLVYIAAPFTARKPDRTSDREQVMRNVREAERIGLLVAQLGLYPVMPTANTQWEPFESSGLPYEFWVEGTKALLRRCDALVLHPRWQQSSGCRGERLEAERLGMPIWEVSCVELVENVFSCVHFVLPDSLVSFAAQLRRMGDNTELPFK